MNYIQNEIYKACISNHRVSLKDFAVGIPLFVLNTACGVVAIKFWFSLLF